MWPRSYLLTVEYKPFFMRILNRLAPKPVKLSTCCLVMIYLPRFSNLKTPAELLELLRVQNNQALLVLILNTPDIMHQILDLFYCNDIGTSFLPNRIFKPQPKRNFRGPSKATTSGKYISQFCQKQTCSISAAQGILFSSRTVFPAL